MRVWQYGDDINTDMLFPGKYTYTCSTPEEIIPHLLEDLDPSFAENVEGGDIILAGKNFGCGSSREQPVVGLKAVKIQAIVAKSFARIFYRAGMMFLLVRKKLSGSHLAFTSESRLSPDPNAASIRSVLSSSVRKLI